MPLNIPAIAAKLNELAPAHPIGKLQQIRRELKKLDCRPGHKVFSSQTIFPYYAFHHGGRKELQFNVGYYDRENSDLLRYGVMFSFKRGHSLPSLDVLERQVEFFNDFLAMHADNFRDMRMWHYDGNVPSRDRAPGLIPSALVTDGVAVILGDRQTPDKIDYERILDDFDRLLPLYRHVISRGATARVTNPTDNPKSHSGIS